MPSFLWSNNVPIDVVTNVLADIQANPDVGLREIHTDHGVLMSEPDLRSITETFQGQQATASLTQRDAIRVVIFVMRATPEDDPEEGARLVRDMLQQSLIESASAETLAASFGCSPVLAAATLQIGSESLHNIQLGSALLRLLKDIWRESCVRRDQVELLDRDKQQQQQQQNNQDLAGESSKYGSVGSLRPDAVMLVFGIYGFVVVLQYSFRSWLFASFVGMKLIGDLSAWKYEGVGVLAILIGVLCDVASLVVDALHLGCTQRICPILVNTAVVALTSRNVFLKALHIALHLQQAATVLFGVCLPTLASMIWSWIKPDFVNQILAPIVKEVLRLTRESSQDNQQESVILVPVDIYVADAE